MAADRFIEYDVLPDKKEVERDIKEFFCAYRPDVAWDCGRWFITFYPEVWIEVCYEPKHKEIDVLTRLQDSATNAMADGLATLLANKYEGRYYPE